MVRIKTNVEIEIVLALLREGSHARKLERQIKESHTTVLRILNRLVGENVLDYKTEGKNKVFFIKKTLQAKNYVFNAERHKLIKLLKIYPEMSVIIEDMLKVSEEKLIILFGSYAKFSAKKDSDIDIYVETRSKKAKEKIEAAHSKVKVKIGEFDLSSLLIKEIIKNHIILRGIEDFYDKTKFFE